MAGVGVLVAGVGVLMVWFLSNFKASTQQRDSVKSFLLAIHTLASTRGGYS